MPVRRCSRLTIPGDFSHAEGDGQSQLQSQKYRFKCIFIRKSVSCGLIAVGVPLSQALSLHGGTQTESRHGKKAKQIGAVRAAQKRKHIEKQAVKLASLKGLRKATKRTQEELAHAMGVGQGTISRLEKRDDMLISTLRHYVESVGGRLHLMVTFSNRPPLLIERLGKTPSVAPHELGDETGASGNTPAEVEPVNATAAPQSAAKPAKKLAKKLATHAAKR